MEQRKIVLPGETIVSGEEFLPGDGTRREDNDIVASRYGLSDISDRLVKVIALSGVFSPRRGNSVIGEVIDITHNGWIIDLGEPASGFLSVAEVPRYVKQEEMRDVFDFGDLVLAKVFGIKNRGLDLSVKLRGFGKLDKGMLVKINANKVPRVIGKEGSMVNIIKEATNCNITVGQNGFVWVSGENIDNELKAKKLIEFICDNSFIEGLTDKVKDFIGGLK